MRNDTSFDFFREQRSYVKSSLQPRALHTRQFRPQTARALYHVALAWTFPTPLDGQCRLQWSFVKSTTISSSFLKTLNNLRDQKSPKSALLEFSENHPFAWLIDIWVFAKHLEESSSKYFSIFNAIYWCGQGTTRTAHRGMSGGVEN